MTAVAAIISRVGHAQSHLRLGWLERGGMQRSIRFAPRLEIVQAK